MSLFKPIRNIPDMPKGTDARIVLDTDGDHALEISLEHYEFSYHFNIDWLEYDEEQVNWLARIIGNIMHQAYQKGQRDLQIFCRTQIDRLKDILHL